VKIPRYTGNVGSAPIQSGRTLTTGTGSAQGMVNLGQSMLDAVSTFAAQKVAHTAKMRDQEILDLSTMSEGESMMAANDFSFSLETRRDYQNFLPEYETTWDKHTKKLKKDKFTNNGVFDEIAWNRYLPNHQKTFMEGKINVQTHISKARNAQSVTAYNTNFNQTEVKLETATSTAQVVGNWNDWKNNVFANYRGLATFDQGTLDTGYDGLFKKANTQMMLMQSGVDGKTPIYQNPNGKTVTDWSKVAERAADPTVKMVDVEGNEITVDDPARKEFISNAITLSNEQEGFDKSQRTENMRTDNNNFNQRLIGIYRGNVDDNFLKELEDNNTIDGPTKKTLASAYSTAVKARNEGKPYYDTIEGKKTESLVTAMVLSGMIDTEEEKSTIIKLAADGMISPDTARSLSSDIEKYQKDKNNHKLIMYRNAVKTVMKAAGAPPNVLSQMDALEGLSGADLMTQLNNIMGSNMTPNAYKAVNNLTLLIAEGEKKGLTMNQMLMNPKSPAYLMNDLVQVYTDKAKEENIRNFELKAKGTNAYIMEDAKFGNYKIDPVGWAKYVESQGGTAQNIQVPPREENEPINTYLLRLQKFNNKQAAEKTGMPTFLRSDVVGGENTQTMIVIPNQEQ
jgi:hypothetical protein